MPSALLHADDDVRGLDDGVGLHALLEAQALDGLHGDVGLDGRIAEVDGDDAVHGAVLDVALSLAPTARKASEAVGSLTKTRAFRSEVAAITGYDVTQMGRVLLER